MRAIIVAYAKENHVIGDRGDIPWMGKMRVDMQHFVKLTTGNTVIMGLRTFYSLPDKFRPLPNRQNIVLAEEDLDIEGVDVAHSLEEAFDMVKDGRIAFIGGGAYVYQQIMNQDLADKIYATEIDGHFDGDVFFPAIDPGKWREVSRQHAPKDKDNQFNADFVEYERR